MANTHETSPAVFRFFEDDFQTIARDRIGRELTADEMQSAVEGFKHGINWYEVAEISIDLATDKQ
jgi:hypothetical protein